MMDVLTQIEAAGYEASDTQLSALASAAVTGLRAGSTYLRVLVAAVQTELRPQTTSTRRKRSAPSKEASLAAFEGVNKRIYAVILAAISVPDDAAETNRRGTFARTAASALRQYITGGGNVLALELASVTKRSLRPQTGQRRSPLAAVERATSTIADRLAKLDDAERSEAIAALQAVIDEYLPKVTSTRALRRVRTTGVAATH